MLDRIRTEIANDTFYQQHFANDGQRFVAWYLRRVLLRTQVQTKEELTDGADDKQMDAVVVDDDSRRVIIVQGKFLASSSVDGEPLREVLGAWLRLRDPESLQRDCNEKLKERLEAVKKAFDDEYELHLELLTTGTLTDSAKNDLEAFSQQIEMSEDFPAQFALVDTDVLQTRLLEAESRDLPQLNDTMVLEPNNTMPMELNGIRCVIAAIPLKECLRIPGIADGRLFRRNVRQFLGASSKVNKGLRSTLLGERYGDFFFYHNGITALCKKFDLSEDRRQISLEDLSVVNGCQSLTTLYGASQT